MDQRVIDLYDDFTHGGMNRREFFDRLTMLTGSTAGAVTLLPLLQSDYARAATIVADDPRLVAERMTYDSPKGKIKGYLVRLKGNAKRPAVVVIHENRGLSPHIEDVARRAAVAGFVALAPDLLSVAGGTPPVEDDARTLHTKTSKADIFQAALAAVPFMKSHAGSTGKVGAVGFCYGGGVVNSLAVQSRDLGAAVAYYGQQAAAAQVPSITAPLLLHYAELDKRINAGIAAYEAALKANNKRYTLHMYPGVNHAFNNETTGRYNKAAADLAWSRTLEFFRQNLGAPPSAS